MSAHITGYLHAAAAAAPPSTTNTAPLFLCEGRATSAQQASSRVAALAAGLTQVLGVQMGDRVCIAALGTDAHLEALLAVTAGGAIAAPLNWRWGAAEAAAAAQLVGARVLLADAACLSYALAAASAASGGILRVLVLLGSPAGYPQQDLAAAEAQGVALAFAESLIDGCPNSCLALISAPGNAALVVFTSGTTGRPKGVTLSHAALHAQSMAKLLTCGYSATDVYLHTAPLFHIGGLSSALAMLAAGARHVFLPRFDGGALLAAIRQHRVTSFIAVPTMVADLLAAASQAAVATLPSVTRILVGGGGMSHTQQTGLAALCPAATVHTAYGMTECASSLTFTTIWGPVSPSASGSLVASPISSSSAAGANAAAQDLPGGVYVGRPPPGIELAVYRPPGGAVAGAAGGGGASGARLGGVQQSGEGEVLTRGPHVMLGYWDDDEATAAAQLPGGWLRTGDLGRLSQGRLWLMGRAKDMIKSGGENVHAWEVEQALAGHPGIATAAVVGVSDWRLGEAVAAAVVLQPGWHWRGQRCQVLLAASPRQEASKAALAAAAAVVLPASQLAASSLQLGRLENGMPDGGGGGEEQALQRCSSPAAVLVEEDFRSTLLQRLPAQASSACQLSPSPSAGMLTAAVMLPSATGQAARGRHPGRLEALQQLSGVAAGLQLAAAVSERSEGDSSSQAGAQDRELDGQLLQAYCRRQGLTGFKLPRIFLLCDDSASGSAGTTLPRNSTGKVVKHLLRQQVQQHMQAGGRAGGEGGSLPRSRM